jgi:ubiquinone/menaquinone biosynthesis C-methylase UbiE
MTADYETRTRDRYRDAEIAAQYHREMTSMRNPVDRFVAHRERTGVLAAIEKLGVREGARVLDVPAGTGKLVPLLRRPGVSYVAADMSPAMLGFIEGGVPRVVADATAVPFPPNAFDLVVCLRLLHRVPEEVCAGILAEIARLAPVAVVSMAGTPRHPAVRQAFRKVLRRPGGEWFQLGPDGLAALLRPLNGRVVSAKNIAPAVSMEYVAAVRFD